MAKKKASSTKEDNLGFDTIEQSLTRTEQFLENNARQVVIAVIAIVVAVAAVFGYTKMYAAPRAVEAERQMAQAIKWFESDSLKLSLNGSGTYYGFLDIADEFGGTPSGKAAHYYAGMAYYGQGMYVEAIEQLDQFPTKATAFSALALGTIGDAFVELGQMDDAADYYVKAANIVDNDLTTPLMLWKAALTFEGLDKNDKALKLYEKIADKYPESRQAAGIESIIASLK